MLNKLPGLLSGLNKLKTPAKSDKNLSFQPASQPKLFSINHDLPPLKNTNTVRANKLLTHFQTRWQLTVLTGTKNAYLSGFAQIHYVQSWYPQAVMDFMGKLRLEKFLNYVNWPDQNIFWVLPAIWKGYWLIKQQKPDIIFVLMMPYSAGLVGIALKWLTGLPLVFTFDDSPSCTDMHSFCISWLHHHLEQKLENFYVQQADAVVYVSQFNLDLVKQRQPQQHQSKLHLIRCGADPLDFATLIDATTETQSFEIVYTGGMNGWYEFYHRPEEKPLLRKIYRYWLELGSYHRAKIDCRSSSPVFAGWAIQQAIAQNPDWQDKIKLTIYGNNFPEFVVQRVLENQNLTNVVSVFGILPHYQAIQLARLADLLFITLPNRSDGSAGGRISCKTYEYLMTDRPILAAVPKGENWNYLAGKPGVWLVEPTDIEAMNRAITQIAAAKFAGSPLRFDRSHLQPQLSYTNLIQDYCQIFDAVCAKTAVTNF
jgi:glycosyltransferase involved in cell wall biosynthesis